MHQSHFICKITFDHTFTLNLTFGISWKFGQFFRRGNHSKVPLEQPEDTFSRPNWHHMKPPVPLTSCRWHHWLPPTLWCAARLQHHDWLRHKHCWYKAAAPQSGKKNLKKQQQRKNSRAGTQDTSAASASAILARWGAKLPADWRPRRPYQNGD